MGPLEAGDPVRIGRYRLLMRLGRGGMGQVYLAETPGHRKVAVKVIRPEFTGDPEFRLRFAREIAAAQEVGGFHTAQVVDADTDGAPPWMATAYIAGPSLSERVSARGPLGLTEVRGLGAALAEGLGAIHACGIIHRDLKPSNIIMADDGPRIIDFGIARRASTATITPRGEPIGTVQYMSPEHLGDGEFAAASDVFSLGAVLAFAATGRPPFDAPGDTAVIGRILTREPALGPLADPLRAVLSGCLAKAPAQRPSLDELLAYFSGTGDAPGPPAAGDRDLGDRHPGTDPGPGAAGAPGVAELLAGVPDTVDEEPAAAGGAASLVYEAPAPVVSGRPAGDRTLSIDADRPVEAGRPLTVLDDDDDESPRVRIRDLPPDVRLRFWRRRIAIMLLVGLVFVILVNWQWALALAVVAGIADFYVRSRTATAYVKRGSTPVARRRTSRQLAQLRRDGYLALEGRPIPGSREIIDHLVIGPTGVYAIDSEQWEAKLPVRTVNGQELFHGPDSLARRLEHANWEASRARELLAGVLAEVLDPEVTVRPVIAIYDARIPGESATVSGVDVFSGPALRKYLRKRSWLADDEIRRLTRREVRSIHGAADRLLPPPASAVTPGPG